MPIRFNELEKARKERDASFEPAVERLQATLVAVDYTNSAKVSGRTGYYWYRRYGADGNAAQVLNRKVPDIPGIPVIIERRPPALQWEVIDWDASLLSQLDDYSGLGTTAHAREHEPGGNDQLFVYLRMITPLRTSPASSGVAVNVAPLVYAHNSTARTFAGYNGYSLSGSVPGAGLQRYTLVYLNIITNALGTVDGDTTVNSAAITPTLPTIPEGSIPSAYVLLQYGDTSLAESDIVDARMILQAFGVGTPAVSASDSATLAEAVTVSIA